MKYWVFVLDLFSFYNSQVGNWRMENKSKETSKYWLKVRQQSIMLKKIPNNICIRKLSFKQNTKIEIKKKM